MVIPVTQPDGEQKLILLEKTEEGMSQLEVETVRFVPLLSGTL